MSGVAGDTALLLLQCYVSFQGTPVVLLYVPQETMGKPSKNGFTNTNRANLKILRDSSILSLCLSLSLSLFLSLSLYVSFFSLA